MFLSFVCDREAAHTDQSGKRRKRAFQIPFRLHLLLLSRERLKRGGGKWMCVCALLEGPQGKSNGQTEREGGEGFSVVVVDKIWRIRRDANFESKSFLPKKRGDKLGAISPHTALQRNISEKSRHLNSGNLFFFAINSL